MNYPSDFINKVITGNHLEIMPFIPDEVIDLTVTSPPYDNLRDYQGYDFKFEPLAKELYRVTKQCGVVVWVVGDATIDGSETGTSFRQALYFKELGFNLHDTMIYEKNSLTFPDTTRYYQCFEYMFIFSKGYPKTIHLITDRKNKWAGQRVHSGYRNIDGSIKTKSGTKKGSKIKQYGVRFNIWQYDVGVNKGSKDRFVFRHPATFPEKLAQDHILSWSNPGDVILDPMCGSGTTLKMAKEYNRKYIGIDLGYKPIAEERLRQEVLPL